MDKTSLPVDIATVAPGPVINQKRYWVGAGLVLVSAFCFALKGIFIKAAYQFGIDTISLLTLRMVFAMPFYGLILLNLSRLTAIRQQTTPGTTPATLPLWQWLAIAGCGITGYYFASYFNFLGLVYITAGLERILLFTYPTFVLFLNATFMRRRISRLQWLALGLTYGGILIAFVGNIGTTRQENLFLGAFWVILSGLVYAVYLVGSDKLIAGVGSQRFTCYAMLAATVPTVVHCAVQNGLTISHFPASVYALAFGMAVVSTVIPTLLIAEGVRRVGSGNASIINSIGPVFTIVLATTLLHEVFSVWQIVGTALVLSGVFLIGWRGKK